jgi:CRP-like cAMP-binding protein
MSSKSRSPNHVLASLPSEVFEQLRPHLRNATLTLGEVLVEAGAPLTRVYFPHDGVISLVVRLLDGGSVEAGMVGRVTVFGAAVALDGGMILNEAVVQQAGSASVLDATHLRAAAEQSAPLRSLLMRHEQIILLQAQQAAACTAFHSAEARLSRWLLQMRDLSGSDTLRLTQEFLAQMIGVRRNSVSIVAKTLQQAGVIRYRRGQISITDVDGLKECACECYETIKSRYDALLHTN